MISHLGKKLLLWIVVLVIIPLGLVSMVVYSQGKRIISDQIYAILHITADSIEARLLSILDDKRHRVYDYGSDGYIQEKLRSINQGTSELASVSELNQHLSRNKKSLDPDILDIFLFDQKGRLVASTNPEILKNSLQYGWVRGINERAIESRYTEQKFSMSAPVIDKVKGEVLGFATAIFRASTLNDKLTFLSTGAPGLDSSLIEKGSILVIDKDLKVISSNNAGMIGKRFDKNIVTETFATGVKSTEEFRGVFNEPRIGLSFYINEPNWVVIPSFEKSAIFSPVERLALKTMPFMYAGLILVVALTFFLTQRFTYFVSEASRAAKRISEGRFDERISIDGSGRPYGLLRAIRRLRKPSVSQKAAQGGGDEISQLVASFNQMAESLSKSAREKEHYMQEIKDSEERYRTLFDFAEDSMLTVDSFGRVTAVNKRLEDVLGYTETELLGTEFAAILDEKELDAFGSAFRQAISGLKPPTAEMEVRSKKGSLITMETDLTHVRMKKKEPAVQIHLRNVAKSKLLEKEVMLERNKLAAIVESMGDGLDVVDKDFTIQFMNRRFLQTFGPEAIGKKCYDVFTGKNVPCDGCPIVSSPSSDSVPEVTTPYGQTLLILHSPIRNMDGTVSYVEIFKDVTEKRRLESAIRELELYNTLFDYAEDSMLMVDLDGRIVAVNKREEKVIGYSGEEVINSHTVSILPEKSQNVFNEFFRRALDGEKPPTVEIEVKGREKPLTMEMDLTRIKKTDKGGLVVVHLRDISRRKDLERQLISAERIAALSHFSSTIAHDLRNPIIGIRQRLKSVQGALQLKEHESRIFTDIIYASELLLGMINDVLDVHRNSYDDLPLIISEFVVAEAVEDAVKLLEIEAQEKKVEVAFSTGHRSLKIYGDKRRLQRVFINLLDNAIKYSDAGKRIELTYEPIRSEDAYSMLFKIEDEGTGINPSKINSIFEPLYKTGRKGGATGTGLGLHFCKVVVDAHGGQIWAENRPGRGAAFYVKIPIGYGGI